MEGKAWAELTLLLLGDDVAGSMMRIFGVEGPNVEQRGKCGFNFNYLILLLRIYF